MIMLRELRIIHLQNAPVTSLEGLAYCKPVLTGAPQFFLL